MLIIFNNSNIWRQDLRTLGLIYINVKLYFNWLEGSLTFFVYHICYKLFFFAIWFFGFLFSDFWFSFFPSQKPKSSYLIMTFTIRIFGYHIYTDLAFLYFPTSDSIFVIFRLKYPCTCYVLYYPITIFSLLIIPNAWICHTNKAWFGFLLFFNYFKSSSKCQAFYIKFCYFRLVSNCNYNSRTSSVSRLSTFFKLIFVNQVLEYSF